MPRYRAGSTTLTLLAAVLPGLFIAGCATHPKGACGPSCRDIESATHIIEYSSQRLVILQRIAERPNLTQHEQEYLVNAIFIGGFGDNMADALVTLMKNSACTQQTRDQIRAKLTGTRMVGRAERRILENLSRYDARAAAADGGPAAQPTTQPTTPSAGTPANQRR